MHQHVARRERRARNGGRERREPVALEGEDHHTDLEGDRGGPDPEDIAADRVDAAPDVIRAMDEHGGREERGRPRQQPVASGISTDSVPLSALSDRDRRH